MVAAFRNLDVRGVFWRRHDAGCELVIQKRWRLRRQYTQVAMHSFQNALDFAGSHHRIHFRHLLQNLFAIPLHKATGHNQFFRRPEFLVLRHFQDGVHGFFLRRLDEAAGVDNEYFRLIGAGRELIAITRKNAHHHLAVHEVLRASQAHKSNFSHRNGNRSLRQFFILACACVRT